MVPCLADWDLDLLKEKKQLLQELLYTNMIINQENTSDESDVSDSSTNTKISFRVSVCLKRYFKDHRVRCYMQVTRNKRVRWLEKRIQRIFSLSPTFCLCSDGHLLPSKEPLALLNPGDCIEVIPLKETKETDLNTKNGCLNGLVSTSDTQPISTENYTSFSYETIENNALNIGNENINQNSKSVVDKNSTELNSNMEHDKNDELISHNMVTNQYESTSNNQKDVDKQNMYDEADGAMETLQEVKQRALHILDGGCESSSEPQRRVRKRVRRRPRRTASPALPPATLPPATFLPATLPTPRPPHLRFSSPPPSQTLSPPSRRCSSPLEVERNEEASARLPRVIRPLDTDN